MELSEFIAYLNEFYDDLEVKRRDYNYNDDGDICVIDIPFDFDNIDIYDNEIIL